MSGNMYHSVKDYFSTMSQLSETLDYGLIEQFAQKVFEIWQANNQVFVFGNGGSACTATHFVADFVKTAAIEGKRRLRAFSLTDNISMLTAIGNDISYADIFRYPLACYANPGDLAVAVSCSGNSPNVLEACQWAQANGLFVVAITGFEGGRLKDLAHLHINVPNNNFGIVENLHMAIGDIAAQKLSHFVAGA